MSEACDFFGPGNGASLARLLGSPVDIDLGESWRRDGPVYGDPRLAPYRLGKQAFQAVVLDVCDRHCAITGSKIHRSCRPPTSDPCPSTASTART